MKWIASCFLLCCLSCFGQEKIAVVEPLPKQDVALVTNLFSAISGSLSKHITVAGTESLAFDGAGHATSITTVYEIWKPEVAIKEGFSLQVGIGPCLTYVPSWDEIAVGGGLTVGLFKLTTLQSVIDANGVSKGVFPRMLCKLLVGAESTINNSQPEPRMVIGLGLPLN